MVVLTSEYDKCIYSKLTFSEGENFLGLMIWRATKIIVLCYDRTFCQWLKTVKRSAPPKTKPKTWLILKSSGFQSDEISAK